MLKVACEAFIVYIIVVVNLPCVTAYNQWCVIHRYLFCRLFISFQFNQLCESFQFMSPFIQTVYVSASVETRKSLAMSRATNQYPGTVLSRGGDTPIHYLYGYVPPNGVVILKLVIKNGV